MTRAEVVRVVTRMMGGVLIALVALSVAVWYMGYSGRAALVESQRAGCERSKRDREANATAWREAHAARSDTASNPDEPTSVRQSARRTAAVYRRTVAELEGRAAIDCREAFPDPRLLEFR